MYLSHSTLRLFVLGMALALAVLASPTATAQSVKGSGEIRYYLFGETVIQIKVHAYTRQNGTFDGSVRLTSTFTSESGHTTTSKETYSVEAIFVAGNQATVWARSNRSHVLSEFLFIDNGDGSVGPDAWGYVTLSGIFTFPLRSGDFTVSP